MNNWKNNLVAQKKANPVKIAFPNLVLINSEGNISHSKPIKRTVSAIKKVCTIIICLLIRLKDFNDSFQLKYLGKIICISANKINRIPMILKCISIFLKYKCSDKGCRFNFFYYYQMGFFKFYYPVFPGKEMDKTDSIY